MLALLLGPIRGPCLKDQTSKVTETAQKSSQQVPSSPEGPSQPQLADTIPYLSNVFEHHGHLGLSPILLLVRLRTAQARVILPALVSTAQRLLEFHVGQPSWLTLLKVSIKLYFIAKQVF